MTEEIFMRVNLYRIGHIFNSFEEISSSTQSLAVHSNLEVDKEIIR